IAKELSLPLDDARRMMQGTGVVPCDKQITESYLGTSKAKGKFVDTLMATATFLTEQKRLPKVEARQSYEDFVTPKYLEAALGKGAPRASEASHEPAARSFGCSGRVRAPAEAARWNAAAPGQCQLS